MSNLQEAYAKLARHYDSDYEAMGYDEDIDFYVSAARRIQGPVLEMGCGSGRILLPTAESGVEVHGMEQSPDMLARLKDELARRGEKVRQRVTLQRGDIRYSQAGREDAFALVTAPFRVIQHLLTRDDQKAWLGNVRRHLRPEGRLIFDVFQPDFEMVSNSPEEPFKEIDYTDNASGRRITRHAQVRHQPELQTFDIRMVWREYDAEDHETAKEEASFQVRWFVKSELESLLELEGFEVVDFWGDFVPTPFGPGASQQIVEARLA
ncbi:MAG TPA: class I SAM-dependent methyltransferase [Acidobacteriota bacterium]|nr:class I SAM-dependent methyltransferase [Acidobacteriota bacterium]